MESFKQIILRHAPLTDPVFDRLNASTNRTHLCQNKHLTTRQWYALWREKLPAEQAVTLVTRPLDTDQCDLVLATEHRSSVIGALLTCNELNVNQCDVLLQHKPGGSVVRALMRATYLDDATRARVAQYLTGVDRLDWCVNSGVSNETETLAAIQMCDSVKSEMWRRSQLVTKALYTFPNIVNALFDLDELPESAQVALAGSHLVVDEAKQYRLASCDNEFVALALVANPVLHDAVLDAVTHESPKVATAVRNRKGRTTARIATSFASVDDPEQLNWLLRRSLPSSFKPDGRQNDLVAIALNPNLSPEDARRVFESIGGTMSVPAKAVNAALTYLADQLSCPPPTHRRDEGFWQETDRHVGYASPLAAPAAPFALDPDVRPWTTEYVHAVAAEIPTMLREAVLATKIPELQYKNPDVVCTLLMEALGAHPDRIELACTLSNSHLGDFAGLLSAVRKLAN